MSSDEISTRVKDAASLLVKGGTLASEPCTKCGGVQVRFADKMTCINCGNQTSTRTKEEDNPAALQSKVPVQGLAPVVRIIEEKIGLLASEIKLDADIASQKEKVELLEIYLRVLGKLKDLTG